MNFDWLSQNCGGNYLSTNFNFSRMRVNMLVFLVPIIILGSEALPTLHFVSDSDNDMLVAARRGNLLVTNSHTVADALKIAKHGDGVFVMAEAMRPSNPAVPQSNTTTLISEAEWQLCNNLGLYVYVEFPSRLPEPGSTSLSVAQTLWERVVVAAKGITK